jgi:hypothetical protein
MTTKEEIIPAFDVDDFEIGATYRVRTIDRTYPVLEHDDQGEPQDTGRSETVPGRDMRLKVLSAPARLPGFLRVLNEATRRAHFFCASETAELELLKPASHSARRDPAASKGGRA